ncbi:MAG: precorrin-6A reductase [Actinomycetota bacterium]|nr:precorrin-6A reductase [Actinomycetota bacterium]
MILVLGGTTEANQLVKIFVEKKWPAIVSTAHAFAGKFVPLNPLIKHISGRLDEADLKSIISEKSIRIVVDATHPYATEISRKAKIVCKSAGIEYIRLERDVSRIEGYRKIYFVDTPDEAIRLAYSLGDTIFIAAGSKNADIFKANNLASEKKLYIRVLPEEWSVKRCLKAGFSEDEVITGIGPFSYNDNFLLWKKLGVDVVITKDSGAAGGFQEKLDAANDLGIAVVVIKRSIPEEDAYKRVEDVVDRLAKMIK